MVSVERQRFQARVCQRTYRHGKNWRQVVIDCAGMCLVCWDIEALEFHEPFGEDKKGWGIFQGRILYCSDCHSIEHEATFTHNRTVHRSRLSEDISIEIILAGGYDNWIKKYELIDRFGWLLFRKELKND